ncbi:hypothetical protein ACROYT_G022982 [Oculina patagonica]
MNFSSGDTSNNGTNDTKTASTACYVNDPFSLKLGRVIAYSVLIFASLVGNILIVALVCRYGRARKTINLAVVNMAVANLVITTVYMPRLIPMFLVGSVWLVEGDFGYALCKIIPFLHTVAIIASVLTLLTSSLDTFCAVVFPLKNPFTTKVAKLAIFLTWALAIVARLPYLISLRTKTSKGRQTCGSDLRKVFNHENARDIYYTFLLVTFCALPWLTILIFYLIIAIILKTGKTPRQESATAARLKGLRVKATRNVIKMMIVITLVFLICWITYFLAQVAFSRVPCSFRFWRMFLAHCNCAINPVLFAVFNTTVRRGIKDIMRKIRASPRHNYICDTFLGSVFQTTTIKQRKLYISPAENKVESPAFSIKATINMTNLGKTKRRVATRRKIANEAELGVVNHGNQENNSFPIATLSFNTLKKI